MAPITIPANPHHDANESLFFARQLEYIIARIFEQHFPPLKARQMFPVNNEAGPGVDMITWRELNFTGVAQLIADYSANLPRVDAYAKENQVKTRHIGVAYGFSVFDVQKAHKADVPLESYKAMASHKAAEQKIDSLAFFGDANTGLVGLMTQPNIPVSTVPADGTGSTTQFVNKTPTQIIRDVSNLWNSIRTVTLEAEMANVLAMPTSQFAYLGSTPYSSLSTVTILEFLRKNLEGLEDIISTGRLAGAGAGGTDVMVAYDRSPDVVELHIPQELTSLPPDLDNLEWVINNYITYGGLIVYRPMAMAIAEGI